MASPGGLGAILSAKAPAPAAPMAGMAPADSGDDLDIPATDLINAVKASDVEGVKAAWRAAHEVLNTRTPTEEL